MSQQLISRSPDLQRLRNDGYEIEIHRGHLLLKNVPYVAPDRSIKRGTLVSALDTANNVVVKPTDHVAHFAGVQPCDRNGHSLGSWASPSRKEFGDGVVTSFQLSQKPKSGAYDDCYHKMTTYVSLLLRHARAIDPEATARTHRVARLAKEDSIFKYCDTATTRAGIASIADKLAALRVGIVGLGGTGSYVLDLVAKTPVQEIHLFDGDIFIDHNAFRAPGAPSAEELQNALPKVRYFECRYSNMRRGIVAHDVYIDDSNVDELQGLDFVFMCIDRGGVKRTVIDRLHEWGISFIDVGIGVTVVDESLLGQVRVTASTPQAREHVDRRIPFHNNDDDHNEYSENIQIADLNALGATLAVIKWKKLYGFYADLECEHNTVYQIDGNTLINEITRCGQN